MRIDLPGCSFKNCKYCSDCGCTSQNSYDTCEFRKAKEEVEVLNAIIKEDCGMLPNYEAYLGNKVRKEFTERLIEIYQNIPTLWGTVAVKHAKKLVKEMEERTDG